MNKEQAKHLSGTLRAVAFAQFAAYGYVGFQESDGMPVLISTLLFLWLEILSLLLLKEVKDE